MTQTAKIVKDSVSEAGVRLPTFQLRYPKFIHGEMMTHRVFSRNASSSRAIPVERLIEDVERDPAMPVHWGKNQPGMRADEEHDAHFRMTCIGENDWLARVMDRESAWHEAKNRAVDAARAFARAGYHKQIVNRLLEPFCHINVIVTATEWHNFFALRCHPAAQPEMRDLAEKMRAAMAESNPIPTRSNEWHLPYVDLEDWTKVASYRSLKSSRWSEKSVDDLLIRISVARCARVSYLTQDGRTPEVAADLLLYDRLIAAEPIHASPAEHQATPDEMISINAPAQSGLIRAWRSADLHGNFRGWIQYRKMVEIGRW